MIDVQVRGDEMINALQACFSCRFMNARGIASAGIAAIDENRFAGGGDDEGSGAALDIGPNDAQVVCGGKGGKAKEQWGDEAGFHGRDSVRFVTNLSRARQSDNKGWL